jgi:hypothetical protein
MSGKDDILEMIRVMIMHQEELNRNMRSVIDAWLKTCKVTEYFCGCKVYHDLVIGRHFKQLQHREWYIRELTLFGHNVHRAETQYPQLLLQDLTRLEREYLTRTQRVSPERELRMDCGKPAGECGMCI